MLNINISTKISIGNSIIEDAISELARQYNNIFVVTGGNRTSDSKGVKKIILELKKNGTPHYLFTGISSNPTYDAIVRGVSLIKDKGFDCILSVGGGSVHDSAKLMAVLTNQEHQITDLFVESQGYKLITPDIIPVYTFPTIVGTGAEISPASLVRHDNHKRIVFSPHMFPVSAFYDLEVIHLDNSQLCMLTGFDAYIQSLEAFVSKQDNLWSDMLAKAGMKNALKGLFLLSKEPTSSIAKEMLVIASIQGLLAVAQSSVGAIHALSDPLSGIFNVHHGTALAMLASTVVKTNIRNGCINYNIPASLFSEVFPGKYSADDLPSLIDKFLREIMSNWDDIRPKIELGETSIDTLVNDSENPDMAGNPVELSATDIEDIFRNTLRLS
ncbi:MAG: iron-containing alcohol dehydrogenase [Candidatus Thiodiazotropha sp. (ex Lucinoma borealis)]|nr:iron-containing alcohol dehydrogenase [Candidatus Thiodiazotropha sp. (ex Lucinoma borealis)]